jgi:hypothetical protein
VGALLIGDEMAPVDGSALNFSLYELFPDVLSTLTKKKQKFSSYMRRFKVEQLQSHIGGRVS